MTCIQQSKDSSSSLSTHPIFYSPCPLDFAFLIHPAPDMSIRESPASAVWTHLPLRELILTEFAQGDLPKVYKIAILNRAGFKRAGPRLYSRIKDDLKCRYGEEGLRRRSNAMLGYGVEVEFAE